MASFSIAYSYGRVRLNLLGPFSVLDQHELPIVISARKCRAVLSYLAMHPGEVFDREHLAHMFWGDRDDTSARQSLRQCKMMLAKAFEQVSSRFFLETKESLGIAADVVEVDALTLSALSLLPPDKKIAELKRIYRGRFLFDLKIRSEEFSNWTQFQADALAVIAADILVEAVGYYKTRGDRVLALEAAARLISADPFREDWQRLYLPLHAECWGRASALAKAKSFVSSLRRELDVEPEDLTSSVISSLERSSATA